VRRLRKGFDSADERTEWTEDFLKYLLAAFSLQPLGQTSTSIGSSWSPAYNTYLETYPKPGSAVLSTTPVTTAIFELWNEPDGKGWFGYNNDGGDSYPGGTSQRATDYLALFKTTSEALRGINGISAIDGNGHWLVGPALGGFYQYAANNNNFMYLLFTGNGSSSLSINNYSDAVSVHPYATDTYGVFPVFGNPENQFGTLSSFSSSTSLPIFSSEAGFLEKATATDQPDEIQAAKRAIRQYVLHLYKGWPLSIYFSSHDVRTGYYVPKTGQSQADADAAFLADYHQYFGITKDATLPVSPTLANIKTSLTHPENWTQHTKSLDAYRTLTTQIGPTSSFKWVIDPADAYTVAYTSGDQYAIKIRQKNSTGQNTGKACYISWTTGTSRTLNFASTFNWTMYKLDGSGATAVITPDVHGKIIMTLDDCPKLYMPSQ
jgi:hypothetical protein